MGRKSLKRVIEESFGDLDLETIDFENLKERVESVIKYQTQKTEDRIEKLLEKKEEIEREIEKKSQELQEQKYTIFNALEEQFQGRQNALHNLHQIKLQSIDLYEILIELVESSIITALEKESEIDLQESLQETIKEITFESIKEGSLNTIRIRKILSTIVATAIDVAEAQPNKAKEILKATLKGMRSGLIKSIDRFKKRLAFMPVEAKHLLVEDYDTIIEDLNATDQLFSQVILHQASQSSEVIRERLIEINKEMKYDLEELVHTSKEAAEMIKEKFSALAKIAVKKADLALHSKKAQEAKKMGVHAFEVAKNALGSALKSAKEAIDKKKG